MALSIVLTGDNLSDGKEGEVTLRLDAEQICAIEQHSDETFTVYLNSGHKFTMPVNEQNQEFLDFVESQNEGEGEEQPEV